MPPRLKELLALAPREAARALVARALRPGLNPARLLLTPQRLVNTERTMALWVSVDHSNLPVNEWKYQGSTPFNYHRLLWTDVFGREPLVLPIAPPPRASDILTYLAKTYHIAFDENDVSDHPIRLHRDGTCVLVASPQSWRWYGTLTVRFAPPETTHA